MNIKKSRKAWDEGMRIERAKDPADHVISTDYSRYGFGGANFFASQKAIAEASSRRLRVEVTNGAKALLAGVVVALVVIFLVA